MFNISGKILFPALLAVVTLNSCYKKPDVQNTGTVNMSGEWFTQYFLDDDPSEPLTNYDVTLTYNTSDNSSSQMWIDDHGWAFKSKVGINYSALSFPETASAENIVEGSEGTFVKIIEGKVLKGAAHSIAGNITDSIYLKVEFLDDDPGTIYQIRGHMKTGFIEDEP